MGNAVRMTRSWAGVYRTPFQMDGDRVREIAVGLAKGVIVLAFLYATSIAWDLVQELREVKLYQLRQVLRIASVGDVLFLWGAYALCREFIRAAARRRELQRHP